MICAPYASESVQESARQRLAENSPYAFYFRDIDLHFADGILTLRGRVPTFYLKQVLQTHVMDLEGVAHIRNQVDVVNSSGLSSVRQR